MSEAPAIGMCTSTLLADPLGDVTPELFQAALSAAEQAGCRDISVWAIHQAMLDGAGLDLSGLASMIDGHGLTTRAVDATSAWAATPDDTAAVMADAGFCLDVASGLGADHIAAFHLGADAHPHGARGLALVADAAAERGIAVAVEFAPWTGYPSLVAAWELVREVDRPNVGIVLDGWHWARQPGGPDPATLRTVPPDRIMILQFDDAAETPDGDAMTETMAARLLPGDGVAGLGALVRDLDALGADPLVMPEVFNPGLLGGDPLAFAQRIVEATRAVYETARA